MTLQREYEALLAMPKEKVEEVSRKIVEIAEENGVKDPTAKRIALAIKKKVSFQTLISDPMISSNRDKFDKFILEAMSQTIVNPQPLVPIYKPGETSNATLTQSMMKLGEDPVLNQSRGGRKSRTHKRKHKRTHKLKLRKDRPIFAEELDKPIAGGKKHRK
jgi:hypothetical protein